ncbi:Two-component response regulator, YesN/AraC family, consists of REC and AraC-type DNA-binding domains [Evansella caseinilytica]|uniref:Two-component response regulator, YesN/AraC family, consists of REC and AraC-type DNA-binding domains n=1 Tax=Evansella caseinilytica TaxID=1503961 RepID=A0A1H3IRA2_9BACI|nr:response regulator [Evansella caseinilytica]SDY30240.1 Two-component response regulator, YesN/AraC family, consists of REC and AraC-type DNA-binding domains [Evansella caseinilytica]
MNIFLVEDECWALAELKELFKRYQPEHTIFAFANGDDALQAAEETPPQLVISDITMPGMTGLELIQRITVIDPAIKCIILSVHDQFDYAQKGLRLGIIDYLLKPVKKEALYQTVDQALQLIEAEAKQREERGSLLIAKMLKTSLETEQEASQVLLAADYCFVYLLAENWHADKGWASCPLTNNELKTIIAAKKIPLSFIYCVDMDAQRKLMLIPITNSFGFDEIQSQLHSLYHQLITKLTVHIAYAKKRKQERINSVYEFLHQQLEKHRRFGRPTFILPDQEQEEADLTETWVKIRMIETHIKNGEVFKLCEVIEKMTEELEQKKITCRQLSLLISNMYYALMYKLQQSRGGELNIETVQENFEAVKKLTDFRQLAEWLEEILLRLHECYTPTEIAPKNLIPRVISWIHHQYQENLLFQQFANEHHISLSYLSREFKAQTGYTFSEYLMRYRMEKAKEFFAEGVDKIGEVCRLVGYEDPKHFSAVFKRIEGVSPKEFKAQLHAAERIRR